ETVKPITADVTQVLQDLADADQSILFEGAQGTFLDVDHGTYPFVTSSNTVAAAASIGTGVGPRHLDFILGIVKAYTTRVGAGPFPTELFDDMGQHLASVGAEFGATTGRPRRCGWFDAVALRRSIINSSVSGLCVTKLDVLDGLETIRICVGYEINGEPVTGVPLVLDRLAECEPVYEDMPGWTESTVGVTRYEDLPGNARSYLERIEALAGIPLDIISTGPDREQTIIKRHPFE
ncbi:MAG: adenylosuccinate synthetase, partial [Woeseia sp.]